MKKAGVRPAFGHRGSGVEGRVMIVLGIHAMNHEAGACLIADGRICAIAEERLTRRKYDGGFPQKSIDYVCRSLGVADPARIDMVVFDRFAAQEGEIRVAVRSRGFRKEVAAVGHHDAHAASAFFASPFEDASVAVVDAFGSGLPDSVRCVAGNHAFRREVQSTYHGRGNDLTPLDKTYISEEHNFGIGLLYAAASMVLGFGELGSGKTMALAAYGGNCLPLKRPFFYEVSGHIVGRAGPRGTDPADPANFDRLAKEIFGILSRRPGEPIGRTHEEIAAYVQAEFESAMLALCRRLHGATRSPNLCMAGGAALNCPTNSRILGETPFGSLFVQPAASDTGIALGCALYGYHVLAGQSRFLRMSNAFLAADYGEGDIEAALKAADLPASRPPDLPGQVASLLAAGRIVGWFEGKSEYGPRALGHRSILADPRSSTIKVRLDRQVKKREVFRPYAPAVLTEKAREWFEVDRESPFMLLAPRARQERKALIPAVVHVDGTSRIQTVGARDHPRLHALIREFDRLTGVPMVLNTSFNQAGDPMVETPVDAVGCFLRAGMDALAIGPWLVTRG